MRHTISCNTGWELSRHDPTLDADTPDAASGQWEPVELPHAWNTSPGGEPARHDDRAPGWYRRRIEVPGWVAGHRAYLRFGAAGTVADVWCNDIHLGQHRGGYSAFVFELTDTLDADGHGNVLVRVDNSPTDDVYPLMGDHTIFGGLYRGAELITSGPVHVSLGDHGGPGLTTRVLALADEAATVEVAALVANTTTEQVTPDVHVTVTDADGVVVATAVTAVSVEPGDASTARAEVMISDPHRWDGRADPYCYTVIVDIDTDPNETGPAGTNPADTDRIMADQVAIPLGLRTIEVDPERGCLLNGRPYPLRGVSRHHDICGTPAVTDVDIATDFELIDELGATAVRLAHYQHGEAVLDECDRRGIVVWAEIPLNSQVSKTDPVTNAASQLRELIAQQRHHPAIVCWGIQNESVIGEAAADPRSATAELAALAQDLDPDRFTAQAQLLLVKPDDPINRLCDLNAQNLYQGWYLGAADEVGGVLDAHRAANPDIPLGLSEYGADARPDYHAEDPQPGDYTEDYQAVFHETYLRQIDERPWLWATFVWNMFDFASVIRDEGGTRGFNMKGLVTRDRATRKDAFHWYKANWSAEPMVHLCGKRFAHRTGDEMTVKVYSNHPSVRVQVNGDDLGEFAVQGHIATMTVPLAPGQTLVTVTAGACRDEATFTQVDEPDPSYVCPSPRRVVGGARMDSWYEEAGVVVDRTGYGTFSLLGDLLDNPATKAVLIDTFGAKMLEHPQLEMARGFSFDFVLSAVAADLSLEDRRRLHEALAAVPKPPAS